jgi:hypothetical protein
MQKAKAKVGLLALVVLTSVALSCCSGPVTVTQLADIIDEKPIAIIKMLMTDLGVMASMTQTLDPVTCIAVARGFGKIVGGADDFNDE